MSEISETTVDLAPHWHEVSHWVKEFLAKPNESLGRIGSVCPFIPLAIQRDTLRFASADAETPEAVVECVRSALAQFSQIEPHTGPGALLRAILVMFPRVSRDSVQQCIDDVQRALRPEFVAAGLMIGEFHQWNMTPGLHSDRLFPLRTPVPCLAIRTMVEQDIVFLSRPEDSPQMREKLIRSYLVSMGDRLTDSARDRAQRLLPSRQAESNVSV